MKMLFQALYINRLGEFRSQISRGKRPGPKQIANHL